MNDTALPGPSPSLLRVFFGLCSTLIRTKNSRRSPEAGTTKVRRKYKAKGDGGRRAGGREQGAGSMGPGAESREVEVEIEVEIEIEIEAEAEVEVEVEVEAEAEVEVERIEIRYTNNLSGIIFSKEYHYE